VTISKQVKVLSLALIAFLSGFSVDASASVCGKADVITSLQSLKDQIVKELSTPKIVKVSLSNESSNRNFYKIDRNQTDMKIFNADGVITANPFSAKSQAIGSAVLISPCHVLTNRHVVKFFAEKAGASVESDSVKNLKVFFSAGQPKSCNTEQAFLDENVSGKPMEVGKTDAHNDDWAVVKLDRPITAEIEVPDFSRTSSIPEGYDVIKSGYPLGQMNDDVGFASVRLQHDRVVRKGSLGITELANKSFNGGLSGGSIRMYKLESGKVYPKIYGINIGGGKTLDMGDIYRSMSKATQDSIEFSRDGKTCK